MNFNWMDSSSGYSRCTTAKPVTIKMRNFGGTTVHDARVSDMGYVRLVNGKYTASVYGSINPDAPGGWFNDLDEAKRYVEEQALLGLTLNKLTR